MLYERRYRISQVAPTECKQSSAAAPVPRIFGSRRRATRRATLCRRQATEEPTPVPPAPFPSSTLLISTFVNPVSQFRTSILCSGFRFSLGFYSLQYVFVLFGFFFSPSFA